jgi:5-methyltetrahydropteroyltriglutamate--homocysteine methyltransferase
MVNTYVVGFPRIGEQRELKRALESYWAGNSSQEELKNVASDLRKRHLIYQKNAGIDLISVNDFSFYDNMIDAMVMLNATPEKYADLEGMDKYFAMARGDKDHKAMEMTKWFNTNYHYIVPELDENMDFKATIDKIKAEYAEAKELGITPKVNFIGLVTFVKLSKVVNGSENVIIEKLIPVYEDLIKQISALDENVTIQFDESYFVTNPTEIDLETLKKVYDRLTAVSDNIFVATYFEHSNEANEVLAKTNIEGMFLDFVAGAENSVKALVEAGKKVGIGIVNGRNVWVNDIKESVKFLEGIAEVADKDQILVGTFSFKFL